VLRQSLPYVLFTNIGKYPLRNRVHKNNFAKLTLLKKTLFVRFVSYLDTIRSLWKMRKNGKI